jgi:hypothetical protein
MSASIRRFLSSRLSGFSSPWPSTLEAVPLGVASPVSNTGLASRVPSPEIPVLDEVGQVEGRLLDASLVLQVLLLEAPVARHWHRVPRRLEVHQQPAGSLKIRK